MRSRSALGLTPWSRIVEKWAMPSDEDVAPRAVRRGMSRLPHHWCADLVGRHEEGRVGHSGHSSVRKPMASEKVMFVAKPWA